MRVTTALRVFLLAGVPLVSGCLVTQTGSLEVLNPKQAYGQSLAVIADLHRDNEAIEQRLASDLRTALSKRGLTIAEDPAEADLVIVPTLGRMRERASAPAVPLLDAASEPVESAEPVIAAPAPEARPFNRFGSANDITRGDLASRRAIPSARVSAGAQQAGLLLTAYRWEDYQDYGVGRQSLPPVWRIYVSQPANQLKWNTVAMPLINAAAGAARPLGKSQEQGAGSVERGQPSEEQPESRVAGNMSRGEKKKDQANGQRTDQEPEKKRKFFRLFGGSADPEKKPAAEQAE